LVSTRGSDWSLKKNKGLVPTNAQRTKICYHLSISDILDEDKFIEKMLIVRHRIINIFIKSVDPRTKKGIPGNYLMGVGPKIVNLKKFMHTHINFSGIIIDSELPQEYKKLNYFWKKFIISKIIRSMINIQVDKISKSGNLWYLSQSGGVWEISQSLADEDNLGFDEFISFYSKIDNSSKPKYRDQRNYHGRPSKQGRRRNKELRQAPGLSTSIAKNK